MAVIVDSNVILDILTIDPTWFSWSSSQLALHADTESLVINQLIYAEISIRFESIELLESVIPSTYFHRETLPWEAAFLAGKAYLEYKKRKGSAKLSPLTDFYIGAHALVTGRPLLTRNPRDLKISRLKAGDFSTLGMGPFIKPGLTAPSRGRIAPSLVFKTYYPKLKLISPEV